MGSCVSSASSSPMMALESVCGAAASCPSPALAAAGATLDRKSTRLNSSHSQISYAVFCLKKKKNKNTQMLTEKQHKNPFISLPASTVDHHSSQINFSFSDSLGPKTRTNQDCKIHIMLYR